MKESNQVRKLLIACAIFVLGIPTIASAIPHVNDAGQLVVRVSYADLDLSSEAGLLTLYKRLKRASNAVCGPRFYLEAGSFQQLKYNKQCYRNALSKAVAKANSTKLDEIHAG